MFLKSKNEDHHESSTFQFPHEIVNLEQISDWLVIYDYYPILILIIFSNSQSLLKHHHIYSPNFIKYLNLDLLFFIIYRFAFIKC